MLQRRRAILLGAIAMVQAAVSPALFAGENGSGNAPFSLAPSPQYADTIAVSPSADTSNDSRRPLMALLAPTSVGQSLDRARINVFGWVEASYEYNFNNPRRGINFDRTYDFFQGNKGYINQIDLSLERKLDLTTHQFDVGGRIDAVYGSDPRFTVANGFLDHQSGEYWFDLPQLYVDIAVPVGNGMRVRVGRFELFKPVDPNLRPFYSQTISYNRAFPFTLTGISATYAFSDQLTVEGGISRGWNQAADDNNGAIDAFAKVSWDVTENSRFVFGVITGPEQRHDNGHYTTAVDVGYVVAVNEKLNLLFDALYGHQAGALLGSVGGGVGTFPGDPARETGTTRDSTNWYGISGNVIYHLSDTLSFGGRLEWFRDENGYLTRNDGVGQNLYEATVGLTVTPFANSALGKNFKLRPEVRVDYSSRPYFNGATDYYQTTVAVDAIFNF